MFDKASDVYPSQEALVGGDRRYTYGELRRLVDRMAYNLLKEGLQRGDRVLLQLPNWPEFVISYFAVQKAGLIAVLLTVNHTSREVNHLAALTQPAAWIVPARYRKIDYQAQVEEVRQKHPELKKVIVVGEDVPAGCLRFDGFLDTKAAVNEIKAVLEEAAPEPTDVCQILPSGGTTGLPKGAPRTHNDYICNVEYKSRAWHLNVTDSCLVASTVGHNLALLVCVTGPIFHGAKVVLVDSTLPQDFCQLVQDERITCTGLVPTLISRIASFDRLADYDLSSLSRIYVGAANSPPDLVRQVEDKIGCRYINAFGMVEGPCAQTRPDAPLELRCATIGRPVCPYDELVTLGPNGEKTPPGVEGELAAKGPGIFTGYVNNPKANKDSFTPDGYFRTGDLAVIDKDGCIRITGRIKDIIIRGGENIAAQEVEELISSHPLVEYVSVVGMASADLGEELCAYIQPVPGATVSHTDIINHLQQIGASKLFFPARTEVMDQLPLTAAGKVDKKALRADIAEKQRAEEQLK
jgi:non-ribosomal peptide synthetase component E (peptide arylation enzyme)